MIRKLNIYCCIFFNFLHSVNEETFDNLLLINPFTITNIATFNNGIKNTFGSINLNSDIVLNSDTINIGNYMQDNIIIFNNLPIGSQNITLPLKYLMIGENSNQIYVGIVSSPLPPPDYISIDNLVTDTIVANSNSTKLTFNNNYNQDTIIGNKNASAVLSANTIYFNNNEFTNHKYAIQNDPLLIFECPIVFTDGVTFANININQNLNCLNTNPINIITKSIEYNSLKLSNSVVIGSDDLSNTIKFNGLCNAISNNITIGSPDNPINKINNLPIAADNTNFFYCINDTNSNFIFVTQLRQLDETVDIFITNNTIEVNFINSNNNANTIIQSENLFLSGNVILNTNFKLSNVLFETDVCFNSVTVNENTPLYFIGKNNTIINSDNTITINNSIFNNVYFFNKNNIINNFKITTDNIEYLSINTDGKICIYPSINISTIKNKLSSIKNEIEIFNCKKKSTDAIEKTTKINNKIKKIIKLLSYIDENF
jgi:hypothetical protein